MIDKITYLLATLIMCESADQSERGQRGVAWVVRNRLVANTWYGLTWDEVMTKKYQFSCFNDGIPDIYSTPIEYVTIADNVINNRVEDPTLGATHYYSTKILNTAPGWATTMAELIRIDDHVFYKE